MEPERSSNHALTLLALLSLFTFAGLRDQQNQWFWVSLRVMGCSAALSAVYGYCKEEKDIQTMGDNARLLEALSEVKQGYEWQQSQLHLQHQRQVEQYEQAIALLHAELKALESSNFNQLETEREKLALDYDRLQKELDRLSQEQSLLEEHYDAQQQSLEAREQALNEREEQFEAAMREQVEQERDRLQAQEDALNERERLMLQQFEQEWAEREEFYGAIADAAVKESHSLKQPDYPLGHSHEELLACEAIRCLYEHGIIVKSPIVKGLKGGRFELSFKILPVLIDGKIATPVRSLGEAFKRIGRDLIKPLRIAVRGCCADPTLEPIDGGLKLIFDVSGTDWEALETERKAKGEAIADPPPVHLSHFIQNNPQISLMGDSGEGKTTLINNLVALMEQEFGGNAILTIVNPKPNEETDLTKLRYADFESCIFGLLEAATEILYRLRLNTAALMKRLEDPNQELPSFEPMIYFFDEFSELAGVWNRCKPDVMEEVLDEFEVILQAEAPEKLSTMSFIRKRVSHQSFAADLLKFCWRVGRTEKVKLLIAGQNLKAGTIGTNVQDLHQTAIIYLGEAIKEGLDNRVSSWQKESLAQEYAFRARKVAEGTANRFYGLFVPKGSKAYFSTLPEQFAYLQVEGKGGDRLGDGDLVQAEGNPAPFAPDAPSDTEVVRELERLWQLPCEDRTEEDRTRTPPVRPPFDPLAPEISAPLIEVVLSTYSAYRSQTRTISVVWNVSKSGSSKSYRAAKWKFRHILHQHGWNLPGKRWGEDGDDLKSFDEVIQ